MQYNHRTRTTYWFYLEGQKYYEKKCFKWLPYIYIMYWINRLYRFLIKCSRLSICTKINIHKYELKILWKYDLTHYYYCCILINLSNLSESIRINLYFLRGKFVFLMNNTSICMYSKWTNSQMCVIRLQSESSWMDGLGIWLTIVITDGICLLFEQDTFFTLLSTQLAMRSRTCISK